MNQQRLYSSDIQRVHIRWCIRRDMVEVMDSENQGFSEPWVEEDYLRCLREKNCIGMVAEIGDKVVGHMVYELNKDHLNILRIVVHPDYQRRSIGQQMITKLISKLSSHRRTSITAEVHETWLPAQLFLRSCGFLCTFVLRGEEGDTYKFKFSLPE